MKISFVVVTTLASLLSAAEAFLPATVPSTQRVAFCLSAAAAAKSKEEDLELTRQVIAKFVGMEESSEAPAPAPAPAKEEKAEDAPKQKKKGKKKSN